MLTVTYTFIIHHLLLLLLLQGAVVERLARCHQADLSYQILSGFVFTHTPSIINTQVRPQTRVISVDVNLSHRDILI